MTRGIALDSPLIPDCQLYRSADNYVQRAAAFAALMAAQSVHAPACGGMLTITLVNVIRKVLC
jgi:hypothetical protein